MRHLLGLLLLVVACRRAPDLPQIALDQNYVFADGGGQLVVGVLLPEHRPQRLASLISEADLERYETGNVEIELEPEWGREFGGTSKRSPAYDAIETELSESLGVRVLIREVMRAERGQVALMLNPRATLVERCRSVLERVRRLHTDPFHVEQARRKNGRAYVKFARRPQQVTLTDLEGAVVWSGDPELGFDLAGISGDNHLLVVESQGLRRAWRVGDLVGRIERDLFASKRAVAGATFAVRLVYRLTTDSAPVAGERDEVRLEDRSGKLIARAAVVSNEQGTADVRLAIPESTPPGYARLRVGAARFTVYIRQQHRISVVTDRTVYRPNDRIFVRLMTRRNPSGRAAANETVVLSYPGGERKLTTSAHGIASTEIVLRHASPGHGSIRATCGDDVATADYSVEAFELPRFEVSFEPKQIRLRKGESAPLRITARYINGAPMVAASVTVGARTHRTNQRGEIELVARGAEPVTLRDADGRTIRTTLPVGIERQRKEPKPVRHPITIDRHAPKVGDLVRVEASELDGPLFLDIFRDGCLLRTLSAPGNRFALQLTDDLAGPLELHAYLLDGHEQRGVRRRIHVGRNRPLHIDARAASDKYRPGDTALVNVTVRDMAGEPTAAVLGYWAVDQALLNTRADFGDGHEATFDLRPSRHTRTRRAIHHQRTEPRKKASRAKATKLVGLRITALDERIDAIYQDLPIWDIWTALSVRERLLRHVHSGDLDPALLLDPWGTPLAFERTDRHNLLWTSAGPDLVWRTPDDIGYFHVVTLSWAAQEFCEYVESRIGRDLSHELGFWDPDENYYIVRGGGAGGGRKGRGGRRNLRAGGGGVRDPVRLRRESSPTLCFVPEALVGPDGIAQLRVPLADALTTWRMRLVASRNDGATGIGYTSIRVRQPLSIDPWIAPHLTLGDELDLPVAARNETDASVRVLLRVRASREIEVIGATEATVAVGPGGTAAHTFRIRARRAGRARLRIDATSSEHSDAVERIIEVHHDGRRIVETQPGELGQWMQVRALRQGSVRVDVYPDPVSEALSGLEGMIRKPHGCFEQTSSTLYPMVLVLDYLRRTQQTRPELEERARKFIDDGFNKLLTYEVETEPGGFSLWGKAPASTHLTAYGLMEFADMARVHEVNPELLTRMQKFLLSKQAPDGSWAKSFKRTAYIAWALKSAGRPNAKARAWLTEHTETDSYALALASLAGATKLSPRIWMPAGETLVGARGRSAKIETTALAAQALLAQGDHGEAFRAVRQLLALRGSDGRFGTTQSTVQALRAILAASSDGPPRPADVEIDNDNQIRKLRVEGDSVRVPLGSPERLMVRSQGNLRYTISRTGYEAWDGPIAKGRVGLEVQYPTGPLTVQRTAHIHATIFNRGKGTARQVTAEIGVPPGCDIEHRKIKGAQAIEKGDTAVVIYLADLKPGERRTFKIPFVPRYSLDVKTAPSTAYEYYTPEEASFVPPARIRSR